MSILSLRRSQGNLWKGSGRKAQSLVTCDLLPRAFAEHEENDCIHVLDVGLGTCNTVEFLKRYRCKIYFLDLASIVVQDDIAAVADVFKEYSGDLFDVCLFWDFLHRLTTTQLELLSDLFEPYIYSRTRAHSLANMVDTGTMYSVQDVDQLVVGKQAAQDYPTRSITQLTQHFQCFDLLTDQYSSDGRLEMLLQAPLK